MDFDFVVIGTGGAGNGVALEVAKQGLKTAAIDRGPWGGTCARVGCVPKKVFARASEIIHDYSRWQAEGMFDGEAKANWPQLMEHKHSFTAGVSSSTKQGLEDAGVTTIEGEPSFVDANTIQVGKQKIHAEQIHIAVGLIPRPLQLEGAEHLIDNSGFLNMERMPERLVFVGGGYISFEFAHAAARLGAKEVTILEAGDQVLTMFDQDIIAELMRATRDAGIKVITNQKAMKVTQASDGYVVHVENGDTFEADAVVHGAGRVPSTGKLNLGAAGVDLDERGFIVVNERLQSSQSHITAAGDVASGHPPLSPIAGVEAELRIAHLRGEDATRPSYTNVPSVLFAEPRVGKVGLLEREADALGLDYRVKMTDTSQWYDAKKDFQQFSKAKTLVENGSDRILGVHVIGNDAEHIVNLYALALAHGMSVEDIQKPIYVFPTSTDDTRYLF